MSGPLATIIGTLSISVVALLAAGGYPPLTPDASGNPGVILVGTAAEFEQSAPPQIIFQPIGADFKIAEYSSASNTLGTLERQHQNAMRTIRSRNANFLVTCWGSAGSGSSPVDDYDLTDALVDAVIASLQSQLPGAHGVDMSGKYSTGSNIVRFGRKFSFGLTIYRPVLSTLLPYDRDRQYAPAGVLPSGELVLDNAVSEGIPIT